MKQIKNFIMGSATTEEELSFEGYKRKLLSAVN